jgi:hypothetical protein
MPWLRHPREWAWIDRALAPYRAFNRLLPANDRCKRCWAPLTGPFSVLHNILSIRPSRKNPRLCTS